jgi:hypothetical protein
LLDLFLSINLWYAYLTFALIVTGRTCDFDAWLATAVNAESSAVADVIFLAPRI